MQQATQKGQGWPENEAAVVADVSPESRERNRLLRMAVALLGLIVLLEIATLTALLVRAAPEKPDPIIVPLEIKHGDSDGPR